MTAAKIAQTVYVRTTPNYELLVDGHPFPWLISYQGPRIVRLKDDLYQIEIAIFSMAKSGHGYDSSGFHDVVEDHALPTIAGIEFPWVIGGEGITYSRSWCTVPTVRLSFYALTVDSDGDIADLRGYQRADRAINDIDGNYWGDHAGPGELFGEVAAYDTAGQVL